MALATVVPFVMMMFGLIDVSTLDGFFMNRSSSSVYSARPFGGGWAGRSSLGGGADVPELAAVVSVEAEDGAEALSGVDEGMLLSSFVRWEV